MPTNKKKNKINTEFSRIDTDDLDNSQSVEYEDDDKNVEKYQEDDKFWDEYYTLLNKIQHKKQYNIDAKEENKAVLDNQETLYRIALNKPKDNVHDYTNDINSDLHFVEKNKDIYDENENFKMDIKRYSFISLILSLIFGIMIFGYFIYEHIVVKHLIYDNNPLVLNRLSDGEFVIVDTEDTQQNKILEGKEIKLNKIMSAMNYILQEGDNLIDVGSSYGYYSIYASKLISKNNTEYNVDPYKGYVFAFEGNPSVFEFFKESIHLNDIKNIALYNVSIFRMNGSFYIDKLAFESYGKYNVITDHTNVPTEDQLKINFYALDSIITGDRAKNIKLININSKGNEVDILLGAKNIINSSPSLKIITTWGSRDKIGEYEKFAKSLLNIGFKFWIIRENGNLLMVNYPEQMTYNDDNILLIAKDLKETQYEISE